MLTHVRTCSEPVPGSDDTIDHYTYHFTRVSRNAKTGPMPVTTSSANTCPATCRFKDNGCYARHGPLGLHWRAVSGGRRGVSFEELLEEISTVRRNALWRHNQAGDLTPSTPGVIDARLLRALARANKGRRGFTYTHYPPNPPNQKAIREANRMGFTVNLSAETLAQADGYAQLAVAPVVVALPMGATRCVRTPQGRQVIVCPAHLGKTDCLNCGICQRCDRTAIVGFPAHGSGAKQVQAVFFERASG